MYGKVGEKEYWLDGKLPIDEFLELYEIEQDEEDCESSTIGGWVTEQYGAIPPIGEIVTLKNIQLKVVKATKQKVLKVLAKMTENAEETQSAE